MNDSLAQHRLAFGLDDVEGSIINRFEKVVQIFGGKAAYIGADASLTYNQLNRHSNRIAHSIIDQVGERFCRVGILLEQSGFNYAATIGALKAGKCFIPLDPHVPPDRLKTYFETANIKCVLTTSGHQGILEALGWRDSATINVENLNSSISEKNPDLLIPSETEGFIIFTSGSTGAPKGVIQSHRSILHNVYSLTREFGVTAEDRQTNLYTPAVLGAQREIFLGLTNGTTAFQYPTRDKGVVQLAQWIKDNKITMYGSVATVFRRLLGQLNEADTFESVRIVKVGGEATYWRDVDLFHKHFSKECKLFCGFSMTETNLLTSMFIHKDQPRVGDCAPLGKPVEGKDVFVLRSDGTRAAPNEVGEICVESRYIATGYVGETAANTNFQISSIDPTLITFRTGDLGSCDEEGTLTFESRKDHQVKIRGFRVDLSEVESALINLEGVHECVVRTHDFAEQGLKIIAYLVPKLNKSLSITKLRLELSQILSSYMIPSLFVVLESIPQTDSGKVNRQALGKPETALRTDPTTFAAPRNDDESFLVSCWESWLEISGIGIDDDFFELGGDSLSATQLLFDINESFGSDLGAEEIFGDCKTIRGMAKKIRIAPSLPSRARQIRDGTEEYVPYDIDFVGGAVDVNRTNRPELYRIDAKTGLRVGRPNCQYGSISLNNLGFRSPDIPIEKPSGTLRIVFLGSSNVFDPQAKNNSHTWPHLAISKLQEKFPNRNMDYLNAAYPGYSTTRIEKLYTSYVRALKPDLIILRTNDINRDTAYLARKQCIYDGVPFRISGLGKKVPVISKVEKNLTVIWRILTSLFERRKLKFEPTEIATAYRDRLVHLIETCKSDGSEIILVECNRLDRSKSLINRIMCISSQTLYMPYLSLKGLVSAERAYQDAREGASSETGSTFIRAGGVIPSDRTHYADSTHFRLAGSEKMAQYLADQLADHHIDKFQAYET